MWPDALFIYCMKGLIHYTTAYPDISTGQDAFLNDWGVILLVSAVVLWVFKEFYHLFFEPIIRPNLVLKDEFQEKVEGRIVWVKGVKEGFFYAYWLFWSGLYRRFPRFQGMDYQFGVMMLTYGLVRSLQSMHFQLMEVNIIPVWGPDMGIWGRICFYGSIPFLLGYILTNREDFDKCIELDDESPYNIALGRRMTEGKVIYFRQTGQYLPQLLRTSQLWIDDSVELHHFWGRVVIEATNISYTPNPNLDYFVLHYANDAPVTLEDWQGVTHLVSNDLKGSQKLSVAASAADPDVLKRQQERTTFVFNPDWEKLILELAESDGVITDEEKEILARYNLDAEDLQKKSKQSKPTSVRAQD